MPGVQAPLAGEVEQEPAARRRCCQTAVLAVTVPPDERDPVELELLERLGDVEDPAGLEPARCREPGFEVEVLEGLLKGGQQASQGREPTARVVEVRGDLVETTGDARVELLELTEGGRPCEGRASRALGTSFHMTDMLQWKLRPYQCRVRTWSE